MEKILLIETSTALCSVALAEDGLVTAYRESSAPKAHASLTAVFVQDVLEERGLKLADCDAVCVSKGPGSYTGLRVGVSTAKGLCFGAGLPLLAVGTLDTLVAQAAESDYRFIIPMIDARRMEVYACVFENGVQITETEPVIVDENSFADTMMGDMFVNINGISYPCERRSNSSIMYKDGDTFGFSFCLEEILGDDFTSSEMVGTVEITFENLVEHRWTKR